MLLGRTHMHILVAESLFLVTPCFLTEVPERGSGRGPGRGQGNHQKQPLESGSGPGDPSQIVAITESFPTHSSDPKFVVWGPSYGDFRVFYARPGPGAEHRIKTEPMLTNME